MNIETALSVLLVVLITAYVVVSIRRLARDFGVLRAGATHSMNPFKAYVERKALDRRVKKEYPHIFGADA